MSPVDMQSKDGKQEPKRRDAEEDGKQRSTREDSGDGADDFEWELQALFKEIPIHPSDPIGRSLPDLYTEDVLLPPAFGAKMVQSEYVNEDNLEEFKQPIRATKYWDSLQYDPAFVDDYSTARLPEDYPREIDFRYPAWLKPHLELVPPATMQGRRGHGGGKRGRADANDSDDRQLKRHRSGHGESPRKDHHGPSSRRLSAGATQKDRHATLSETDTSDGRRISTAAPPSREASDDAGRQSAKLSPPWRPENADGRSSRERGNALSDTEARSGWQSRSARSMSSRNSPKPAPDVGVNDTVGSSRSEEDRERRSVSSRSSSLTPLEAELLGEDSGEEERRKRAKKSADLTTLKTMPKKQVKPNKNRMNEAYR